METGWATFFVFFASSLALLSSFLTWLVCSRHYRKQNAAAKSGSPATSFETRLVELESTVRLLRTEWTDTLDRFGRLVARSERAKGWEEQRGDKTTAEDVALAGATPLAETTRTTVPPDKRPASLSRHELLRRSQTQLGS